MRRSGMIWEGESVRPGAFYVVWAKDRQTSRLISANQRSNMRRNCTISYQHWKWREIAMRRWTLVCLDLKTVCRDLNLGTRVLFNREDLHKIRPSDTIYLGSVAENEWAVIGPTPAMTWRERVTSPVFPLHQSAGLQATSTMIADSYLPQDTDCYMRSGRGLQVGGPFWAVSERQVIAQSEMSRDGHS